MDIEADRGEALVLAGSLVQQVNTEDVASMVQVQRGMLQRFEKTNEMLINFNQLSSTRYEASVKDFQQHTHLLYDMKKDLDCIFKRIRVLKQRLSKSYPEAFAAASSSVIMMEEAEEDDDDFPSTSTDNNNTSMAQHNTYTQRLSSGSARPPRPKSADFSVSASSSSGETSTAKSATKPPAHHRHSLHIPSKAQSKPTVIPAQTQAKPILNPVKAQAKPAEEAGGVRKASRSGSSSSSGGGNQVPAKLI